MNNCKHYLFFHDVILFPLYHKTRNIIAITCIEQYIKICVFLYFSSTSLQPEASHKGSQTWIAAKNAVNAITELGEELKSIIAGMNTCAV